MKIIWGLMLSLFFNAAWAASGSPKPLKGELAGDREKIEAPAAARWKANTDKFFYDLQGEKEARGNIYSFDRVTLDSQVLRLSYAPSLTTNFSINGVYNKIYAETYFSGDLYKDRTEGFGDTWLKAAQTFLDPSGVYVVEVGGSIPTGSVREKNKNAPAFNYPYNMQLGSGTPDFNLALFYLKPVGRHALGAFTSGTFRTGRNAEGYRKGNEGLFKTWYNYNWRPYFAPGIWANYHLIDGISGQDETFGRNLYTEFYHASRSFWDLTPHVNGEVQLNTNLKIRGSLGAPLLQHSDNVDDIQVYLKWFAQLGIEGSF